MKKTLIALAALAATGASFAQVTMTGNIGISYQKSPFINFSGDPRNNQSYPNQQGLQVQDGEFNLTATEDLGGGYSATARGGLTIRGRDSAPVTRDATVSLTTPFGRFTGGAIRTCGPLVGVLSGVVTGPQYTAQETSNNLPLQKCSLIDTVSYAAPIGPVTLVVSYNEFGSSGSTAAVATSLNTASAQVTNAAGNVTGLVAPNIAVAYAKGPLTGSFDYTRYSQTNKTFNSYGPGQGALAAADGIDAFDGFERYRLVGTYDLGVAKLGLGIQAHNKKVANQYAASIAVPMGSVVFGLDYTAREAQGALEVTNAGGALAAYAIGGGRDGDKAWSSVGVGATYSFSKSTTINASYIKYDDSGANSKYAAGGFTAGSTPALLDEEYRIRLMKTF